jgi:very-short-patch-repair endonuclease
MTDAERRLWYRLRARRFEGLKFKRQVPVCPYVVDFANLHAKIIIEIDGGQHSENRSDKIRDRRLIEEGFVVLRFWNDEVLLSTDAVLAEIASIIRKR